MLKVYGVQYSIPWPFPTEWPCGECHSINSLNRFIQLPHPQPLPASTPDPQDSYPTHLAHLPSPEVSTKNWPKVKCLVAGCSERLKKRRVKGVTVTSTERPCISICCLRTA